MKHVVVDLEMNYVNQKSEARNICNTEIIEIGAVMLDNDLSEISTFKTYVKPEFNDCIVGKISQLTGITYEMVANAPAFSEALRMFTGWCTKSGDEVTIYAWSDSDYLQIKKEMRLKDYEVSKTEEKLLLEKWSNFQQEFNAHLGFKKLLSLKVALEMAGIGFTGREHDALDDARNTAELLQVFKNEKLFDVTLRKLKECMEPKSISSSIGELFDCSLFAVA